MKEIKLNQNWYLQKVASFGDDIGSHCETVFFCDEVGFILVVDDIRIDTEFFQIDKDEFLEFMEKFYHDSMLYVDDIGSTEPVDEIPQFEGTLDALSKLTIRKENKS